ncbi:Endonuclease III [Acholeplasma oculi]|uniref:Endonuclease III n=1 Tax=Acholeplasma oculi TaxID=35623 RepID=A0A061ABQ9_9MOLU|nr:endonuclease III [Acholeplasma oculi]CDR31305.1 Endonuclease III [Acholeplasma oculi]SKC38889.1 DNA-(apurinic or apyrimidinic site) lyase /endonuclease III [Acholeplasma oculi]SUT91553.1 Endonuclease III [Acholeplasma oculi]
MTKSQRIFFSHYLEELFPDAKAELNFTNHFELIVAVVLSAQTTDIAVNKVTKELFKKYPTPNDLMHADIQDVMRLIQSIGLYKTKAKNIIELSRLLVINHQGVVPSERKDLESLPGVGRKTANVVLSNAFGIPALAVDTHILRISKRLGLADESDDAYQSEMKLNQLFDQSMWHKLHHQLIFFGRYHCKAQKPNCDVCQMKDVCKYYKNTYLKPLKA